MSEILPDLAHVLAEVRRRAVALAQQAWPELGSLVDSALPEPMDPVALLPMATGAACGAEMESLIPAAAALTSMALALRILDDCADQDNPNALQLAVGPGRAMNAAAALSLAAARALSQISRPGERRETLAADYAQAFLAICHGQDRDLRGQVATLSDYRRVVELKTVAAYEFGAAAGAHIATLDPAAVLQCKTCGGHLGWMIQILDDLEALWFPDGPGDLSRGRLTLPILVGLSLDHPCAPDLGRLWSAGEHDPVKICGLLDAMDIRARLVSMALDHRDRALEALGPPLRPQGRAILQPWLDWLWRDGERLLANDSIGRP